MGAHSFGRPYIPVLIRNAGKVWSKRKCVSEKETNIIL